MNHSASALSMNSLLLEYGAQEGSKTIGYDGRVLLRQQLHRFNSVLKALSFVSVACSMGALIAIYSAQNPRIGTDWMWCLFALALLGPALPFIAFAVNFRLHQPSKVWLFRRGFQLLWSDFSLRVPSPEFEWADIASVSTAAGHSLHPCDLWIVLNFHSRIDRGYKKIPATVRQGNSIRLNLQAFSELGARRFLQAIGQNVPNAGIGLLPALEALDSYEVHKQNDGQLSGVETSSKLETMFRSAVHTKQITLPYQRSKDKLKVMCWPVIIGFIICAAFFQYFSYYQSIFCFYLLASFLIWQVNRNVKAIIEPGQVQLDGNGLLLRHEHWLIGRFETVFSWEQMLLVRLSMPNNKETESDNGRIIFYGNTRNLPLSRRLLFTLLFTDFAKITDRCKVSLLLGRFVPSPYRVIFSSLLEHYLSSEQISSELKTLLNPEELNSYTALWLDSLLKPNEGSAGIESLHNGAIVGSGHYEVLEQIGCGGQGTVYKARALLDIHSQLKQGDIIVLKEFVIPLDAGLKTSRRMLNNISREAEVLKSLDHDNIVRLLDFFAEDQRTYLVLNHISGESLRTVVEEHGRLSESEVVSLALQMCDILTYLHGQSPPVVHRDFTPENLMLDDAGKVILIDFNVAQQLENNKTDTVVGKHSYMPVEQFRGAATTQSDIYALGATMFYLLTGKDPEPISSSHPKAKVSSLSPFVDAIVAKATAQDSSERYFDTRSIRIDLLEYAALAGSK